MDKDAEKVVDATIRPLSPEEILSLYSYSKKLEEELFEKGYRLVARR